MKGRNGNEEQKKKGKATSKKVEKQEPVVEENSEELDNKVSSSNEVANIAPTILTGFKDKEIQKEEVSDEIPPMKKGEPVIDSKVSNIMVTDDQFFDDFFDD